MSIENHPNIHAVKFTVELLEIILGGNVPTINEMQVSYLTSLRGKAKEMTPEGARERIGFDQLAEMLRNKLYREHATNLADFPPELLVGFITEVSCRLDRAFR